MCLNALYLAETPNNALRRRPFKTDVTLSSRDRKMTFDKELVDSGYTGANVVINEALVPGVCAKLQIQLFPLSRPKPLRGFDG